MSLLISLNITLLACLARLVGFSTLNNVYASYLLHLRIYSLFFAYGENVFVLSHTWYRIIATSNLIIRTHTIYGKHENRPAESQALVDLAFN